MCLPPDTAKGPLMQEHTACMTRNAFHAPDTAKGTLIQGTKKYNTEHNVPAPDSAKGTLMQGHTIHHTCQVSLHPTPPRVHWCKNTRHTYNKHPKHQTPLTQYTIPNKYLDARTYNTPHLPCVLPPDTAKGTLMQEHTACMTKDAFRAADTAKGTLMQGSHYIQCRTYIAAADNTKVTLMHEYTIHHTCHASFNLTPLRAP